MSDLERVAIPSCPWVLLTSLGVGYRKPFKARRELDGLSLETVEPMCPSPQPILGKEDAQGTGC